MRFELRVEIVVLPLALRDVFQQLDDGWQQIFGLLRRDLVALVYIEICVEVRAVDEELDLFRDFAHAADARLQQRRELRPVCLQIVWKIAGERAGLVGKLCRVHGFEVLAVDPAQLVVVEDGRGLREALEAEMLDELLHGEDFLVRVLRVPAEECDVVYDGLRQVAGLDEVVKGGGAMALRELRGGAVGVLAHDRGEVNEGRQLPAVALVEQYVLRRGGDEFRAADDVRDVHEMVVDDVGEVIGRHAVALQQHLILQLFVRDADVAVQHIEVGRLARERHLLTDDVRVAVLQVRIDDILRQVAAGAVVAAKLALRVIFVRVAEAVVGVAELDELFRVFLIDVHALTLYVRCIGAAEIRALVRHDFGELQRAVDEVHGICDVAGAVRVLDAQDKGAVLRLGVEIGVECRAQVADVHVACGARGEAGAYILVSQDISSSLMQKVVFCFSIPAGSGKGHGT